MLQKRSRPYAHVAPYDQHPTLLGTNRFETSLGEWLRRARPALGPRLPSLTDWSLPIPTTDGSLQGIGWPRISREAVDHLNRTPGAALVRSQQHAVENARIAGSTLGLASAPHTRC